MTPSQASFTGNTAFFFRDVLVIKWPLNFLFFMELFQCCIPSIWLKYFSTRWISMLSWALSGIAVKPNRSSIGRSLEPSIALTTWTLFVKHSSMILSFPNGLSFEKVLGLLITPLCFLACGNPITVVSVPLGLPFYFIFGGILTSLKASKSIILI